MPEHAPIERETLSGEPIALLGMQHEELEPVIGQLQKQLNSLLLERAAILKRIGVVKKTVVGLADLFGNDVINKELQELLAIQSTRRQSSEPGLTHLCRQLLKGASKPLTIRQILRELREKYPASVARQRSPENSLRTILGRLVEYAEAEEVMTEEGFRAWTAAASAKQSMRDEV